MRKKQIFCTGLLTLALTMLGVRPAWADAQIGSENIHIYGVGTTTEYHCVTVPIGEIAGVVSCFGLHRDLTTYEVSPIHYFHDHDYPVDYHAYAWWYLNRYAEVIIPYGNIYKWGVAWQWAQQETLPLDGYYRFSNTHCPDNSTCVTYGARSFPYWYDDTPTQAQQNREVSCRTSVILYPYDVRICSVSDTAFRPWYALNAFHFVRVMADLEATPEDGFAGGYAYGSGSWPTDGDPLGTADYGNYDQTAP